MKISTEFGAAVRMALDSRGLSVRGAKYKTGIDSSTILNMRHGEIPRKGVVIDFAQALRENVNDWLVLASYSPIPVELVVPPGYKIVPVEGDEDDDGDKRRELKRA